MEKFEIVRSGHMRFMGKSIYTGNKTSFGCFDNLHDFLWKQSEGVFRALDEIKEYACGEVHNAVLFHWEKWDKKNELFGTTIGRFMKADTPIMGNKMDYIDIPAEYIAKGFVKGKYEDRVKLKEVEKMMEDELKRRGYVGMFITAEVFPEADENGEFIIGFYIPCNLIL